MFNMTYINDLKISHVKAQVVTHMVKWLKKKYEYLFNDGLGAIKACHGKIHDYLGMNLNFSVLGEVKIMMIPYVKDIMTTF